MNINAKLTPEINLQTSRENHFTFTKANCLSI